MREVPECLQRRYKAMDDLITDLGSAISNQSGSDNDYPINDDRSIKLMCKFWNILKEDPNCNLQQAVQQRMVLDTQGSGVFGPRNITCYQTGNDDVPNTKIKCGKETCAKTIDPSSRASGTSCCNREQQKKAPEPPKEPEAPKPPRHLCPKHAAAVAAAEPVPGVEPDPDVEPVAPLTQALGIMKEANTAEKKCYQKTAELKTVQEQLKVQIAILEEREEDEVALLKEADDMWTTMEDEYKMKLQESRRRQDELIMQQKEVETSVTKWRKNKNNLEEQMKNVDKCIQEIRDKYKKRTNDLKTIEAEMVDMTKRIEGNTKELANASNEIQAKKQGFEKRMEKLAEESKRLQIAKTHEEALKEEKIAKGNECVKEAREELAKICRVLLKKKLENEDLRAEAKALIEEKDLLQTTCDQCGERCKNKEENFRSEIAKCKAEIEKFQLKCTKCHVSVDTQNLRKYCTDCPRCQEELELCVYGVDKCSEAMNECVCMDIKNKFMNNVFENMYTVLDRQINTKPGKAVAEQVLKCLKGSTNGKLDPETRKKLQNFILASVKTNLNLTIIGGAVKTRCEMDPDTYKEMLLCLSKVKTQKPQKADKGTDSRKDPCARWGGTKECNCPNGPKNCICKKKAPPRRSDPAPCGQLDEDKQDIGELSICPHKDETPCGPLCGNVPKSDIATKLSKSWKPAPCAEKSCSFSSNVKTARCSFGNTFNSRATGTRGHKTNAPIIIDTDLESLTELPCDCGGGYNSCVCYGNTKCNGLEEAVLPSEEKLRQMFNNQHSTVPVTVVGQNGTQADLNAELRKTTSGHMALDVRRISNVGDIASNTEEYPVSLFQTNSKFKLIISQNNTKTNAVLKKGPLGQMNVVLKHVCKSKGNKIVKLKPQEKLLSVRVKNVEAVQDCTFLKRTPSDNFEFVLWKEFEKLSKKTISDTLGDNTECSVNLTKTTSGTYVIDFNEGCNCWKNYHNALLTKSDSSGNIKLIVQGLDFTALKKEKEKFYESRTGFENLYKKLSTCVAKLRKIPHPKQNRSERIVENGILLDEKIRMKIKDQDYLVADLKVVLNKISPGQYYVTFHNKAAIPFIGNLLNSWLGLLPVQRISERNLTIGLNWGKEQKPQFGWLMMACSGEIVMVVDGKVAKGVQLDAASVGCDYKECGITTNCYQKSDCSDCDQSKCICDEISQEQNDWWNLM